MSNDKSNDPAGGAPFAAAAASEQNIDDDTTIAAALQMVETLTVLYGFDHEAASEAVEAVGTRSVKNCVDYILDHGGIDKGGAITPENNCPHLPRVEDPEAIPPDVLDRSCCYYSTTKKQNQDNMSVAPTGRPKEDMDADRTCPKGENWLCLSCGDVYCSRYVNAHGLRHWEETGHCVMVSLADISVWCHACAAYVLHNKLEPIVKRLQEIKFNEDDNVNDAVPGTLSSSNPTSNASLPKVPRTPTTLPSDNLTPTRSFPSAAPTSRPIHQCPCKLLPSSFSSFTAAEFGDLNTLSKIGPGIASRKDKFGYTPLHLAAQNNHVAATALLLQLGCHADGHVKSDGHSCSTPLHRAAFSGATAAMKVLLDWKATSRCDLLARDTSYGDNATPLHKAASGGRYLAVHLLLKEFEWQDLDTSITNQDPCTGDSLLTRGLCAKDKEGRTPLDVANYYFNIQDTERKAVAHWDGIAGGIADWGKCVQLLASAAGKEPNKTRMQDSKAITEPNTPPLLPQIPMHLRRGVNACMDCDLDGHCITASWQASFQKTLFGAASAALHQFDKSKPAERSQVSSANPIADAMEEEIDLNRNSASENTESNNVISEDHGNTGGCKFSKGICCGICRTHTIALYPRPKTFQLVCKKCLCLYEHL